MFCLMRVDMSSAGILYTKQGATFEEKTFMRQEYVPSSISKCAATSQSATTWPGWCVRLDLLLAEQFVWDADVAAVSSAKVNQYADGAKALTSKTLIASLQFDDANALEAISSSRASNLFLSGPSGSKSVLTALSWIVRRLLQRARSSRTSRLTARDLCDPIFKHSLELDQMMYSSLMMFSAP